MQKSSEEMGLTVVSIGLFLLITAFLLNNWDSIEALLTGKVSSRLVKY